MPRKLPIKAEYWWLSRSPIDEFTESTCNIMLDNLDDADIAALVAGRSTPRLKSMGKKIAAAKIQYNKKHQL